MRSAPTPPPGAASCDAPGAAGSYYNGTETTDDLGVASGKGQKHLLITSSKILDKQNARARPLPFRLTIRQYF